MTIEESRAGRIMISKCLLRDEKYLDSIRALYRIFTPIKMVERFNGIVELIGYSHKFDEYNGNILSAPQYEVVFKQSRRKKVAVDRVRKVTAISSDT